MEGTREPLQDTVAARIAGYVERRRTLEEADRYWLLKTIDGPTNHRVSCGGRELVMLGSYSYLGLIGHPRIDAAAKEAIDRYGSGAGGVRLLTGTIDLHERLERRLAAYAGRADAVLYSSGYVANVAILTALAGPGDLVVLDKLDHASIVDGCLLSGARWRTYRHNDMAHLDKLLRAERGKHGAVLVVADSIFSMDGDLLDLPRAWALCREHGARLVVDEAHSVGALGATGRGIEEHFDMPGAIDVKMGTLSKAIPSVGGYVAGDEELVGYLRHYSRPFIFSAALPPAQAAAALAALDVIAEEPWRVRRALANAERFRSGLRRMGYDTGRSSTCVIPVLVGDEQVAFDLTRELFARGLFVCPIAHPAVPRGQARLRTTVMATHTDADLDLALAAFEEAGRGLGLLRHQAAVG
jgi:8-amino-7-oxononanoate synthase